MHSFFCSEFIAHDMTETVYVGKHCGDLTGNSIKAGAEADQGAFYFFGKSLNKPMFFKFYGKTTRLAKVLKEALGYCPPN